MGNWGPRNLISFISQSNFARGLFRFGAGLALSQALMVVYTVFVVRSLAPVELGLFSSCYSLAGLTAFLLSWGMDTWLLRESQCREDPRRWVGSVVSVKLIFGAVWGGGLILIMPSLRPDIYPYLLMAMCVVDVWCDSALTTQISGLTLLNRSSTGAGVLLTSRVLRVAGLVALMLLGKVTPYSVSLTRALATVLGLLLAAVYLKPKFAAPDWSVFRKIWRFSIPFGLSEGLATIYMQADVTMLAFLAGKATVGIYAPASGLVNALFVIPSSVYWLAVPRLSKIRDEQPALLRARQRQFMFLFGGIGFVLSAAVFAAGEWLVTFVFGPAYRETAGILLILSPILFLKSLEFGWAAFLISIGWQQRRLIPQAASAVLNVGLNLWMIPRLGIPGVALVYVVSEIVLTIGYAYLVYSWFKSVKLSRAKN